jgi:Icc-related predicted phosphoesterase
MRIGLLGDTHADDYWMSYALDKFRREGIDTIIQLGDLGIYRSRKPGKGFLDITEKKLAENGQMMVAVPGNHEDYDYIESIPVEDGWQRVRPHIGLPVRGHRWELEGRTFVALGGAPSVDRSWRVNDERQFPGSKLWWHQEAVTGADVDKVKEGGYADVMVAHDAPLGVPTVDLGIRGNPMGFQPHDLEYALEGRKIMREAFDAVQPKLYLHGHYHFHVNDRVDDTHVLGLSCNQNNYSLGELDTETLRAEAWNIIEDFEERRGGALRAGTW